MTDIWEHWQSGRNNNPGTVLLPIDTDVHPSVNATHVHEQARRTRAVEPGKNVDGEMDRGVDPQT